MEELLGVVDRSVQWEPKTKLPGTYKYAWYWSSEQSYREENVGPGRTFVVYFYNGAVGHLDVGLYVVGSRARCVRESDGVD